MILPNIFTNQPSQSGYALVTLDQCFSLSCPANEMVTGEEHVLPPSEHAPYFLLLVRSGSMLFHLHEKTTVLPGGSLLFLSSKKNIRFRAGDQGLEAWIFCLRGNMLSYYYNTLKEQATDFFLPLPPTSPLWNSCAFFMQQKQSHSCQEECMVTEHVSQILGEFLRNSQNAQGALGVIPPYLQQIKELFDFHYERHFSLDDLSVSWKISKYRLCREFGKYYGVSPVRYLNKVRIQNACLLLVSEDLHVGEIAAKVGIENVNHFIRLFKEEKGMTPTTYRQTLHP